jgi:hypothetical protein
MLSSVGLRCTGQPGFACQGRAIAKTQYQDLYINTYLRSNSGIKITQMAVVERSAGTLLTNYYGAVTSRPLGVPKRQTPNLQNLNLAVKSGYPETSRSREANNSD